MDILVSYSFVFTKSDTILYILEYFNFPTGNMILICGMYPIASEVERSFSYSVIRGLLHKYLLQAFCHFAPVLLSTLKSELILWYFETSSKPSSYLLEITKICIYMYLWENPSVWSLLFYSFAEYLKYFPFEMCFCVKTSLRLQRHLSVLSSEIKVSIYFTIWFLMVWLGASAGTNGKEPARAQETGEASGRSPAGGHAHSSILAYECPWTGPGPLQSVGLHRGRHHQHDRSLTHALLDFKGINWGKCYL